MKKDTKSDANTVSSSKADKALTEEESKNKQKSRRRLIQFMVAGGVVATAKSVPNSWSRPVVNSVTLPAHAQTSLIILGNNRNLGATDTQDMEQTESLLASGISNGWAEIYDTLVQEAEAGADGDDGPVECRLSGCNRIEYSRGANSGMLYIGVLTLPEDSEGPTELVMSFTDGQLGFFTEACGPLDSFRVDLVNDTLAMLTIFDGIKDVIELELVNNFDCTPEPTEDFIEDDGVQ